MWGSMVKAVIADDSRFMRKIIRKTLEKIGVEVVAEASNGREAIEFTKQYKPNLVILDINMPEMDGLEALKHIATLDVKPKIIVLTAVNQQWARSEAESLGVIGFLSKPFKPSQLLEVVKNAVG